MNYRHVVDPENHRKMSAAQVAVSVSAPHDNAVETLR